MRYTEFVNWTLDEALAHFSTDEHANLLRAGLHGLEKESLRTTPEADLALTPHPESLGDKWTTPHLTTDFSESQLEFITPPFSTPQETIKFLEKSHFETVQKLDALGEKLWPFSMPCRLPEDREIPIAYYGEAPAAKAKEIYRRGLAARYGKAMQTLCGVHYNISFSKQFWEFLMKKSNSSHTPLQTFMNEGYLRIVRNFTRHRWILVYLFGASPAFDAESYRCESIARDKSQATSLRLSRCGYANPARIDVDYNMFDAHLASIRQAVETPYPPYTALGLERDGEPLQLNDHLLQIPNEYYFPIRIKPLKPEVDMLTDLESQGAGYLEVRLFDVNPLAPSGVTLEQLQFTQLFLLFCLFEESPPIREFEVQISKEVQTDVALHGALLSKELQQEGSSLFERMKPVAERMGDPYTRVHKMFMNAFKNPEAAASSMALPWKTIKKEMTEREQNFLQYGTQKMNEIHEYFMNKK